MIDRRITPHLIDALMVIFLIGIGFMAGTQGNMYQMTEDKDAEFQEVNQFPESELKQVKSNSGSDFIQAPYTQINSTIKNDSIEVDISAVAFPEGKSMRPTIFSDNMVLLEEYEGDKIKEGQIIRYQTEDGYVIHRVQANYMDTSGYLLMKGDNNDYSTRVEPEQVTHRVLGVLFTSKESTSG